MASPIVTMSFSEAIQKCRSIRALESQTTVLDSVIVQLAEAALLTVPSPFDSQTTRLSILFGNDHKELWSVITADALRARIGEERWNAAGTARLASTTYGTILI